VLRAVQVTSVISRVGGIATSVWQHDRPLSTPHGIFVASPRRMNTFA
jgi:hypothetical protein